MEKERVERVKREWGNMRQIQNNTESYLRETQSETEGRRERDWQKETESD